MTYVSVIQINSLKTCSNDNNSSRDLDDPD